MELYCVCYCDICEKEFEANLESADEYLECPWCEDDAYVEVTYAYME